jgi:hypothetical protein
LASSPKKKSKSKSDADVPTKADVVDAVVIEETDAGAVVAEEMDTVDEMADADGVSQSADNASEDPESTVEVIEEAVVPLAPAVQPAKPSNPFWALVLGGLVAACLGFFLARYMVPEGWPFAGTAELEAKIEAQVGTIEGLSAQIEDANSQSEALGAQITEQTEQIVALEAQLAALTEQVNAEPEVGTAELPADLAALLNAQKKEISSLQGDLRSMAEFAEGQILTAQQEAEAAERAQARATARDSLNTVRLALASGEAFEDVLPGISGAVDVPAVLSDVASGVATQSALQGAFGPAARAALAASNRELAGDSAGERASLFFKDLIGARSLTPQEGDSPDAVLSRVEAAVLNGDLTGALSTIEALPDSGKAELTEWSGMAKARNDALQAFSDLTDALSAD